MRNLKFTKILFIGAASILLLAGCGEEETPVTKEEIKSTTEEKIVEEKEQDTKEETVVPDTNQSQEESKVKESKVEESETTEVPLKTTLTVDEFNNRFKLDEEEEQYPNGKFELKDGSVVNADSYSYGESDLFDYAIGIFHEGNVAHLQIETQNTVEEFANALGITLDNAEVVPNKFGFEIIFDHKFSDENISVFPDEWE
ncbi:MAG: hypothetical protein ACQEW2_10745 [Bacillota bacterium]